MSSNTIKRKSSTSIDYNSFLKSLILLLKPRVMSLVIFTSAVGYITSNSYINTSNAKEYLQSLSKEELSTLQHYTLLVDDIDVDKLNDEGAYNLLLHHYEKFDFNNDGLVSNGIGNGISLIIFAGIVIGIYISLYSLLIKQGLNKQAMKI